MSRSGRASEFMRAWQAGKGAEHVVGCGTWGADDCDRCTADAYGPWEALVWAAKIAGFLEDDRGPVAGGIGDPARHAPEPIPAELLEPDPALMGDCYGLRPDPTVRRDGSYR